MVTMSVQGRDWVGPSLGVARVGCVHMRPLPRSPPTLPLHAREPWTIWLVLAGALRALFLGAGTLHACTCAACLRSFCCACIAVRPPTLPTTPTPRQVLAGAPSSPEAEQVVGEQTEQLRRELVWVRAEVGGV